MEMVMLIVIVIKLDSPFHVCHVPMHCACN